LDSWFESFRPRATGSIAVGLRGGREHHGGSIWRSTAVYFMAARKQRETEGAKTKMCSFTRGLTNFLQLGPAS
jgi:hypothetical protein